MAYLVSSKKFTQEEMQDGTAQTWLQSLSIGAIYDVETQQLGNATTLMTVTYSAAGGKDTAKALILTNASAVALTEDTDMNGLYTIAVSAGGAQNIDFYLPVDDVNVNEQIVIKTRLNSAVVINTIDFQVYAQGAWITDPAYGAGPVAADGSSEEWTSMFPLRDMMNIGNKHRIRMNVAGDCTGACIAMVVAL